MKNRMNIPSLRILCATVVLSLVMVGCGGDDDEENPGNHKPVVNINQTTTTVNVGTTVNLTALATDSDNDALTHKWSFSSRPTGSSATLTTDTTKITSFTADKAGKYVIEFTAKDTVGAETKDTITITAKDTGAITNTCNGYTELKRVTYSKNTTLSGCYKVTGDIDINNNALLTIEAGSTLVFGRGVDLEIGETGALKAVGTADKPIIFTAEEKTAGYWEGINFYYSNNVKNELAHIIVEYGGGGGQWYGNLHIDCSESNPARLKIRDSIFRNGLKNGFYFAKGTILDEFKNVTSTKNEQYAGSVPANLLSAIDSTSKFTGNIGHDQLYTYGGAISKDSVWNKLSVPVFVNNDIDINAFLTIKAGSKFIFNNGIDIEIGGKGSLTALGTAKEPILFTGAQKTAGYWEGINFYYSNNVNNELAHIIVEYGGGGGQWYGNLHVDCSESSPSRLKIRDSIFRNGLKNGFYFAKGTILNEFKNVTSTKNEWYAGSIPANLLSAIDSTSQFTGNIGHDQLYTFGGAVSKKSVWNKLSVPVFVNNDIDINNFLTIKAGSKFVFNNRVDIEIGVKGSLKAIGTAKEPILFTGEQKTAGYWEGINFYYSNNVNNELDHIIVEYGGGGGQWYGNLHVDCSESSPSRLTVKNSTFSHGTKHGIWLSKGSIVNDDIETSNTFIDNVNANIGRSN